MPHVQIVLIAGPAGCGKSTIGKALARQLHWPYLDKDTLSHRAVQTCMSALNADPYDRESALYLTEVRPLEYQILWDVVIENADLGLSVIVSAPFLSEVLDTDWYQKLKGLFPYADLRLVWVTAPADMQKKRIIARQQKRDQYKLEHWEEYQAELASLIPRFPSACYYPLTNDGEGTLSSLLAPLLIWLRSSLPPSS